MWYLKPTAQEGPCYVGYTMTKRIREQFGLEDSFKGHLVELPCNEQGHLQLHQVDVHVRAEVRWA